MLNKLTKVKIKVKSKIQEKEVGWRWVLEDLRIEESKVKNLIEAVNRKIEKGEPWPGSNSGQQHSV